MGAKKTNFGHEEIILKPTSNVSTKTTGTKRIYWNGRSLVSSSRLLLTVSSSKAQRPDDAMSIYDQSQYISHSRNPSQVGEGVGYQNRMLNNSPSTMSRHPSQQDDFGNGLFQSGVEMHEDPFTGIGSHASVMSTHQEQYEQTFLTSGDEMGLHALGQAASIQKTPAPSYLHPSSAQQPLTKKRRLSSTSNYPDNYGTAQPSNNTFVPSPTTEREEPFQPKLPPDTTAPPNEYKCPECDKIKKRECDLK